jgi:UDP-glucose 4-epimerase
MMRLLIVGGAGEIGQYLTRDFSGRGWEVTVMDRAPRPSGIDRSLSVTYLQGDIAEAGRIKDAVQGQDAIVHLAWSFADDAPTIFGLDIQGHIHLLEAAAKTGIRHVIYTSTAVVYGRATAHPVTESHPCLIAGARKPLYALGKYAAEELSLLYSRDRAVTSTIFRFWWAFGETIGGRHLRDLVRKALNHQPLEMVRGAGGAFLTMADLAQAIRLALEKPAASGQIYNLGSLFMTWDEIGRMIIDLTSSKSAIQFIASDQWKGPAFLNEIWDLSWDKASRALTYKPQSTAEETRSSFAKALQNCIAHTMKEGK